MRCSWFPSLFAEADVSLRPNPFRKVSTAGAGYAHAVVYMVSALEPREELLAKLERAVERGATLILRDVQASLPQPVLELLRGVSRDAAGGVGELGSGLGAGAVGGALRTRSVHLNGKTLRLHPRFFLCLVRNLPVSDAAAAGFISELSSVCTFVSFELSPAAVKERLLRQLILHVSHLKEHFIFIFISVNNKPLME